MDQPKPGLKTSEFLATSAGGIISLVTTLASSGIGDGWARASVLITCIVAVAFLGGCLHVLPYGCETVAQQKKPHAKYVWPSTVETLS